MFILYPGESAYCRLHPINSSITLCHTNILVYITCIYMYSEGLALRIYLIKIFWIKFNQKSNFQNLYFDVALRIVAANLITVRIVL